MFFSKSRFEVFPKQTGEQNASGYPFKTELTSVIFIHYKPPIVIAILYLQWMNWWKWLGVGEKWK